ncbi:MAG: uroporphyrinogen decarboxylase [Actinobacteria bacterium]|nr:uroporphyrinogen decarboxylase [Actinomycetota bacterium]
MDQAFDRQVTAAVSNGPVAEKPWEELTADERRDRRIERWRNPDLEFISSEAAEMYRVRVDRLLAALNLEVPDRVPFNLNAGTWPAVWAGIDMYDVMRDPPRAAAAWRDFNLEFQPDSLVSPLFTTTPAPILEHVDYRLYFWPGHGVPYDANFQYNEREWMLPEEYDHLISDPSDYMLRVYLPRTVGAFGGFARLSSLFDFTELPFIAGHVGAWGSPEMTAGLEGLAAASRAVGVWSRTMLALLNELRCAGQPSYAGGGTKAPFDILGDTLRGTKGVVVDMYRRPEKIVAACERLVPIAIDWVLRAARPPSTPLIFIPLHKGADGFMSDEQFDTFYWPTLKKVILGLIEQGLIPYLFAEGRYGSRLKAIMDLPRARTVWLFDQTDMTLAKETIGRVACIQGNIPLSMIHAGTEQEIIEYTRALIDSAGEHGGFILDIGAVADGGREQNLRAMIDTVKLHGVYR